MPPPPSPASLGGGHGTLPRHISTSTNPPLPLFKALSSHPPDKAAIIDYDSHGTPHTHTYHQLLQSISLGRSRLLELHDTPAAPDIAANELYSLHGARIAFLASNSYPWVATLLSIWAAGGVAVPLCTTHPAAEIAYVVGDSSAALILATQEFTETTNKVVETIRRDQGGEVRVGAVEGLFSAPERPAPLLPEQVKGVEEEEEDLPHWLAKRALIIYTSGTTSRPKGVVTTHLNLATQSASLLLAWQYSPADHLLHILPLHHVHGILNCTLTPLLSGATIEFLPLPFNPSRILTRLAQGARAERENVTLLMAVPTIYTRLLEKYHAGDTGPETRRDVTRALSVLRLAVSGSASLPTSVRTAWGEMSGGGTLLERYGMTEIGMGVSCGLDSSLRPVGAVGWVLPGYEVGLRCVDDGESPPPSPSPSPSPLPPHTPLPAGAIEGEILIRGPGIFTEYWNRPPSTTAQEFLPREYLPSLILSPGAPFPTLSAQHILGPANTSTTTTTATSINTSPASYAWFKTGDFARVCPTSPTTTTTTTTTATITPPPLTILGRLTTDILKSGGEKISALEIEHEILALCSSSSITTSSITTSSISLPPITEVCVVGLPSHTWGTLVAAVVVVDQTTFVRGGWDEGRVERELRAALRLRVALWKVPKVVRVVEALERNVMGKVVKRDLVRRVFGGWRAEEN